LRASAQTAPVGFAPLYPPYNWIPAPRLPEDKLRGNDRERCPPEVDRGLVVDSPQERGVPELQAISYWLSAHSFRGMGARGLKTRRKTVAVNFASLPAPQLDSRFRGNDKAEVQEETSCRGFGGRSQGHDESCPYNHFVNPLFCRGGPRLFNPVGPNFETPTVSRAHAMSPYMDSRRRCRRKPLAGG